MLKVAVAGDHTSLRDRWHQPSGPPTWHQKTKTHRNPRKPNFSLNPENSGKRGVHFFHGTSNTTCSLSEFVMREKTFTGHNKRPATCKSRNLMRGSASPSTQDAHIATRKMPQHALPDMKKSIPIPFAQKKAALHNGISPLPRRQRSQPFLQGCVQRGFKGGGSKVKGVVPGVQSCSEGLTEVLGGAEAFKGVLEVFPNGCRGLRKIFQRSSQRGSGGFPTAFQKVSRGVQKKCSRRVPEWLKKCP